MTEVAAALPASLLPGLSSMHSIFKLATLADALSIVGAIVSVITLLRVRRISQARKAERELVSKALRLRDLNSALTADAETLDGAATSRQQETVKADLLKLSAELEAATRILVPEAASDNNIPGAELRRDGYWTDAFADKVVREVGRHLYIVTWRNSRAVSVGLLEAMFRQLKKNPRLEIHIFAVACDASDETYESMSRMLTLGNSTVMRREQEHYREVMKDVIQERLTDGSLAPDVVKRLRYYETRVGAVLHCIVADDDVHWGVNFFMDPGSGATELLNRSYVYSPARSEFGRKVVEQVDIMRTLSTTTRYQPW